MSSCGGKPPTRVFAARKVSSETAICSSVVRDSIVCNGVGSWSCVPILGIVMK
jgi:hypothetical protein